MLFLRLIIVFHLFPKVYFLAYKKFSLIFSYENTYHLLNLF